MLLSAFQNSVDKDKVLKIAPWTFKGSHAVLKKWDKDLAFEDLDFSSSLFWAQNFNLSLNKMTLE